MRRLANDIARKPWIIQNFCFGPSESVRIFLNGPTCQGATDFKFGRRPTCLQPELAGGSTDNSSLQMQPNKSRARVLVPMNRGRAVPRPSGHGRVTQVTEPRRALQTVPAGLGADFSAGPGQPRTGAGMAASNIWNHRKFKILGI